MEASMIRGRSPESSLEDFTYKFNNTIEGTLINYFRCHGQGTFQELIEHVISNSKCLRTKYSKKYRNKNIEKLALSKLVSKQHIFIESQSGFWTLNENAATEYEQKKISEIKEIDEKKHELMLEKPKKDEKEKKEDKEKFKIFNELIDMDIFIKLEQLEEILESSNEDAQKQILALFKPLPASNISSKR